MSIDMDPIALTRKLVSYNTINPPGNERECVQYCGHLLEDAGFTINYFEFADKRTTVVANLKGVGDKLPICYTGHLDTVPLGTTRWRMDPFAGEVEGDRLYGRGTADMKAGVAAMILMARHMAAKPKGQGGIILILTAGEETSCEGAQYVANMRDVIGQAGAIVVGEPTSNYPIIGHKGCIRLMLTTKGVTAHASMPELGDNAIYKAADVVKLLQDYDFDMVSHPLLGEPTLNIGTISGGLNINSVPDRAMIGLDIRTIPGKKHTEIQEQIKQTVGYDVEVSLLKDAISIATDPENAWVQEVFVVMERFLGKRPEARAVSYFTDASALTPAYGHPPTIILGPGEAHVAHTTDEYCLISKIEEAVQAYIAIAENWCEC